MPTFDNDSNSNSDNNTNAHLKGLLDGLDVVWQRGLLERDVERPELAALARELLLRGEAPQRLRHVFVLLDHKVVKLEPCRAMPQSY